MNLLFDLDNTLYNQFQLFNEAFKEIFPKSKLSKQIYINSRKHSDKLFQDFINGKILEQEMQMYRLQKAFEDYNIETSDLDLKKLQDKYQNNQYNMKLSKYMVNLLKYCNDEKINIGIVTNGTKYHQTKKIQSLDLTHWFDNKSIFISDEIGMHKPSIEIFEHVLSQMNISKNNTYFIGDSIENDIIPAKKFGLKTIYVDRNNDTNLNYDNFIDFTISKDKEIYTLVRALNK